MSESDHNLPSGTESVAEAAEGHAPLDAGAMHSPSPTVESRGWWIKLVAGPALFLASGVILLAGLGLAQRLGFTAAGGGEVSPHDQAGHDHVLYVCPMLCTPPQAEPGRCPVCGMELEPTVSGGTGGSLDIQIDPAARRVANIHTVAVKAIPVTRTIRAVGELSYDEGKLKTISAYVDGRLERLYANYTGIVVQKGDELAILYSPQLYASQAELLAAGRVRDESRSATLTRVREANRDLYENARRRLIELGMTEQQVAQLEASREADSRLPLHAPISGTVIDKRAIEGQYVKAGDAIYQLADLSTVWLQLRLFPEDAAAVRYGQKVVAEVQSLPGRTFAGRIAFVDPHVDPKTRTVGIRVVIPNEGGSLRVGDYAKATVQASVSPAGDGRAKIYEPELVDKWISPRHPHVIESAPGKCRECGVELVPASQLGFTSEPAASGTALVVPRDAVLMAGTNSIVYVETNPGRFEIRRVELGPSTAEGMVILSGVDEGEVVAARGNFLIDSQMQLAGNPSLVDPTRLESLPAAAATDEILAALARLSPEDRDQAESQRICPVSEKRLGWMGTPEKVDVDGTPIFICCGACRQRLMDDPATYLARLGERRKAEAADADQPQADLPPAGPMKLLEPPAEGGGESDSEDRAASPRQAELPRETVR